MSLLTAVRTPQGPTAAELPRFAVTKIQPPRPRTQRIERPALDAALLEAVQHHRVVLLQAAAGFGKSSALASLVQRLLARGDGTAVAWVSMDEDDDAARLCACIAAALEPWDLPWRTLPEALVAQMQQGPLGARRATEELLNAMAHADVPRGVIVLEDLHRVRNRELADLGNLMIDRLPAHWTFVLSSREATTLALARQRALGELAEFGPEALRFSAAETQAFLAGDATTGLGHATGAPMLCAAELHERTQGWPAGLRLAAMAQRVRPVGELATTAAAAAAGHARVDRHLFDYLAAEVLDALPAPLHEFLLRTSVLRELTAARAAAVSGDMHAALRLDEIERRGLFATALDAAERTLVLHDLFRDALATRLRQRLPGEVRALLQRAAASEPEALRRIGYLLRAEDWPAAESALDEAAPTLFLRGAAGDVQRVIEQFDAGWRERSPALNRLAAMVAYLRWDWPAVERLAAQAVRAAQALEQAAEGAAPAGRRDDPAEAGPEPGRANIRDQRHRAEAVRAMALYALDRNAESEALIAALHREPLGRHARRMLLMVDATQRFRRGEHETVHEAFAEVLDSLLGAPGRGPLAPAPRGGSSHPAEPDRRDVEATLYEWWECVPAPNWSTLPGLHTLFERFVDAALARLANQPLAMRGEVVIQRAFTHLWAGRIEAARADAAAAEDDFRWLACSGEMEMSIALFRVLEGAMAGRAAEVQALVQSLFEREPDAAPERKRLWQHQMAMYGIRSADVLGLGPAAFEHWAQFIKEDPLRSARHDNHRALTIRARHAAARGAWADAAALFERLLPRLATIDIMGQHVELRLRTAHALLRAGSAPAQAAAAVSPALMRIADEGCIGHALMAGPEVLRALAAADWQGSLPPALQAVLRHATTLAEAVRGSTAGLVPGPAAAQLALAAGGGAVAAPAAGAMASAPAAPMVPMVPLTASPLPGEALSSREAEVLELMARGDSNKLIARALDISPHTVKRHVANILDKLALQSRGQAAAWFLQGRAGASEIG